MKRTLRVINGEALVCHDIGCDDLTKAEDNRQMVTNKENISFYLAVEAALRATPEHQPLPEWIPTDFGLYNRSNEEN